VFINTAILIEVIATLIAVSNDLEFFTDSIEERVIASTSVNHDKKATIYAHEFQK